MSKLAQFFQEDNGTFSATRLAFLTWVFGALIMWGVSSFQSPDRKMQEVPQSVQVLIGILMTGKVVQKFREEEPEAAASKNAPDIIEQQILPQRIAGNNTAVPVKLQTQSAGEVAQI